MYKTFNMGIGAELYVKPFSMGKIMDFIQEEFGIETSNIGHCDSSNGRNNVRIENSKGTFNYTAKGKGK